MLRNTFIFCIILCLMILSALSCAGPAITTTQVHEVTVTSYKTTTTTAKDTTTALIWEAVDAYLSSGKAANISAEDLYKNITDNDPGNDFFILDVRSNADYIKGHISGAINIPWLQVAKTENLSKLPKDRKIVVYCYTGHTGSQTTALLNILGYDAINLKFGMTSWTLDKDIATGRYNESSDCKDYPVVTGP